MNLFSKRRLLKTINSSAFKSIGIICSGLILFTAIFYEHPELVSDPLKHFRADPAPIPTIELQMVTASPEPTTIPTPIQKYTQKVYPTKDPDPPVLCNISDKCGGGTKPLKQSECNNSTCCQIGDKWIFYQDKSQCTRDQGGQVKYPVQQTPGNNYYCWNNAYGYAYYTSSGDQCNLDNSKSGAYKICMDTQKIKSNTCSSSCKLQSDKDSGVCAWAYTGSNAGIENNSDKYGECLNGPGGVSENYGICLGKCTDQYAQDIKQCVSL